LKVEIGHYAYDNKYVYFSDLTDKGYLYRADLRTGEKTRLANINNVSNIQLFEDQPYLYLRAADPVDYSTITYKISTQDWSIERLTSYEDLNQSLK